MYVCTPPGQSRQLLKADARGEPRSLRAHLRRKTADYTTSSLHRHPDCHLLRVERVRQQFSTLSGVAEPQWSALQAPLAHQARNEPCPRTRRDPGQLVVLLAIWS